VPDLSFVVEAGVKAFLYASILLVVGASAVRWLLLPRIRIEAGSDAQTIESSAARVALVGAALTVGLCVLRLWAHTLSAFGLDGARSWTSIRLVAVQSRWGHGWQQQVLASTVLLVASGTSAVVRASWPLATAAAIYYVSTLPLLGHANGHAARMGLDVLHVLGAGCWLGTLAVVMAMRFSSTNDDAGFAERLGAIQTAMLRRFSPVALSSAAAIVISGLVPAWIYVGSPTNLYSTRYGRILLVKLGLVGLVGACGFVNWRRVRRAAGRTNQRPAALVTIEVCLAIAVVVVTAFLTEIGHP